MYHTAYLVDTQAVDRYVLCSEGTKGKSLHELAQPGQCWASVRLEPVKGGGDGT